MANIIGKLDDLEKSVQAAALEKINESRGEALQQAQKIKDTAQSEAETLLADSKKQSQSKAEQQRENILASARIQAIQTRLTAREEVLDQVWQQTEQKLHTIVESDSYEKVLKQLAFLAVQTIGTGEIQLSADPLGQKLLTDSRLRDWSAEASASFEAKVTFGKADQASDTWGGLIATNPSARKRLDARFSQRLNIARKELRDTIYSELTGKS